MVFVLLAAAAVGAATGYLSNRFVAKRSHKVAASAGAAVLAALAAHGVGWVEKFTARPQVSVTTTRSPGMVDFAIRVGSGAVEALAIDYHVSGHVVGVEPLNVGHHRARATATLEGEPVWPPYYTNRLHLDLRDMQGKAFNYKALWRPVQSAGMSVGVGGGVTDIDRYRVSYSWLFKGDRQPEEQWYLMSDNSPCDAPTIETSVLLLEPGPVPSDVKIRKLTLLDDR